MFDSNVFSQRLLQLMKDNDLTEKALAENLSIKALSIYRYLKQKRTPALNAVIEIADFFSCKIDFLLGNEAIYYEYHYQKCENFSTILRKHLSKNQLQIRKLHNDTSIPEISISVWLRGVYTPTIDNVMILANYFHLGVDDFLGR